jgi:hypothetical protein
VALSCSARAVPFRRRAVFNENYYAAEEVVFVAALKRQGRFAILAETVITSGRKMRAHSFLTLARLTARLAFLGSRGVRSRKGLEYWYKPKREKPK